MPKDAENTPRERRLVELFNGCFKLILQLKTSQNYGDPDRLRQQVKSFLEKLERNCADAGYREKDVESAMFAIVACLDETIISSTWTHKSAWRDHPLQIDLYQNYNAGEAFFERLGQMLKRPSAHAEVLEIYYLCMVLGFKGQYLLHQPERWKELIRETHQELTRVYPPPGPRLSPNGLSRKKGGEMRFIPNDLPVWIFYAAIFLMGLLFYGGLYFSMSYLVNDMVKTIASMIH